MGNKNSNDDFSKNPNFNINEHNQAMRHLQANYTESNYQIGGHAPAAHVPIKQTEFKSVHRTASIYKPSIQLHHTFNKLKVQFDFDSDNGSKLQIYIGVLKVQEYSDSKITMRIDSSVFYEDMLSAGKKVKYEKEYSLNGMSKMSGCNVILRIISLNTDEKTEYTIKNVGKEHWKVLLEKLEINGMVTQLHNIYKGGSQNDQCIICFTQKVNTLIMPCNHLCLCYDCSDHVKKSSNTCPICRTNIQSFTKIKSN